MSDQRSAVGAVGGSVLEQDAKGSEKRPPALRGDNWQPEGKQGEASVRDFGLLVALSVHSAVRILRSLYNTRMTKKLLCNALSTNRIQLAHTPVHRIVLPRSTLRVYTTSRLRQDRASITAERHHVSLRRGSLVARVPTHDQTRPPRRPSNSAHHRSTRTRVCPS